MKANVDGLGFLTRLPLAPRGLSTVPALAVPSGVFAMNTELRMSATNAMPVSGNRRLFSISVLLLVVADFPPGRRGAMAWDSRREPNTANGAPSGEVAVSAISLNLADAGGHDHSLRCGG
jgi:hypothetical protein